MATQLDASVKDDLKTQFVTREGTYRLLTLPEYSRPNRVGYTSNQSSPQVRISIVSLPSPAATGGSSNVNGHNGNNNCANGPLTSAGSTINGLASSPTGSNGGDGEASTMRSNATSSANGGGQSQGSGPYAVGSSMETRLGAGMSMHTMMNGSNGANGDHNGALANHILGGDRICFNFGRELYVYAFRGVKKCAELSKPIDKKFYKGTNPSCHDFNASTATPSGAPLLVGFTTGQIQLVSPQPGPREMRKLYNEERLIDKTKVTCLKWLPNSPNLFLASHASGHLYLYNEDLPCSTAAPNYQPFKLGDGYTILTCKSKSTRNPLYKWVFNTENCCINEFCFSPCGTNLAIVSQDGFLRVFHYDTMELLGIARSYFGGFLCVCWSPDGKYIVVGGEDDLVTVWSLHERRVVARGQGHRSWVSVVAFDPFTTSYTNWDGGDFSDDENQLHEYVTSGSREERFPLEPGLGSGAGAGAGMGPANGFDSFATNDRNSTPHQARPRPHSASFRSDASSAALAPDKCAIIYRLGSVSQDTQVCLWDITEDVLRHPLTLRQRVNSANLNDSSYMNGGVDADGVKIIRPITIGSASSAAAGGGCFPPPQHSSSPTRDSTTAVAGTALLTDQHSNSNSSSKFSTANCTISSHSSNANTPPDESLPVSGETVNAASGSSSVGGGGRNSKSVNAIKFPNCISATKSDSIDGTHVKNNSSAFLTSGYSSGGSGSGGKGFSSTNKSSDGLSTFNSLTQRLSNFSFLSGSDKKSGSLTLDATNSSTHRNHRKAMSLLRSYNNSNSNSNHPHGHNNANFANSTAMDASSGGATSSSVMGNSTGHSFGSLKLGKLSSHAHHTSLSQGVVTTYDPMKLIGTPACPRFDECPLLEPLVCKKIAHERLTALIFREDCFLTACQDGFIYTWARPGYATNVPQHLSPSQVAPPGGTVI